MRTTVIGGVTVPRLRDVKTMFADALFPRFCVGCGREGSVLCRTCDEVWAPDHSRAERDGGSPTGGEEVWFLAHYADPIARGLLTTWKYHFDETAWGVLARRLRPSLSVVQLRVAMAGIDAVVPVPLSRERRAERGFDQAERIAQWLGEAMRRPVVHLLDRAFTSGHQAERSIADRKRAMAVSPFQMRRTGTALPCPPTRILLVDDVWTTGATMRAAICTLAAAGITHIQPMTMLKG